MSWFSSVTPFAVSDSVDYLQLLKDKMTLWIGKEAVRHGKHRLGQSTVRERLQLSRSFGICLCVWLWTMCFGGINHPNLKSLVSCLSLSRHLLDVPSSRSWFISSWDRHLRWVRWFTFWRCLFLCIEPQCKGSLRLKGLPWGGEMNLRCGFFMPKIPIYKMEIMYILLENIIKKAILRRLDTAVTEYIWVIEVYRLCG